MVQVFWIEFITTRSEVIHGPKHFILDHIENSVIRENAFQKLFKGIFRVSFNSGNQKKNREYWAQ